MGTSPNVAPPYIVESGHPDRITDEPVEDIDTHTYEQLLQAGQDTVDESETIRIDPSLLSSSPQNDNIFLGTNPDDDLDEGQVSLARCIKKTSTTRWWICSWTNHSTNVERMGQAHYLD